MRPDHNGVRRASVPFEYIGQNHNTFNDDSGAGWKRCFDLMIVIRNCLIQLDNQPDTTGTIVDLASLMILAVLGAGGWFWLQSIRILEIAREAGRQTCSRMNVQFLDDTVASTRLGLARDNNGRRILRRTYRFEFSETGDSRREGEVVMLGDRVERVAMEPYQIVE